jgi:hypothetical protein
MECKDFIAAGYELGCLMGDVIRFPFEKITIEHLDPNEMAIDELVDLLADLNKDLDLSWEELMHVCLFGMAKCGVNSGYTRQSFNSFLKSIRIEELDVSE